METVDKSSDISETLIPVASHCRHLVFQGRISEAKEYLDWYSNHICPNLQLLRFLEALIYFNLNDLGRCVAVLLEILDETSDYSKIVWMLGRDLRESLRLDLVEMIAKRLSTNDDQIKIEINSQLYLLDHLRELVLGLRQIVVSDSSIPNRESLLCAIDVTCSGNLSEGTRLVNEIIHHNPKCAQALQLLGIISFSTAPRDIIGGNKFAEELFRNAAGLDPQRAFSYSLIAAAKSFDSELFLTADTKELVHNCELVIQREPECFVVREVLAWAEMWRGNLAKGLVELETARNHIECKASRRTGPHRSTRLLHPYWLHSFGHFWGFEILAKCVRLGLVPDYRYVLLRKTGVTNRALLEYYREVVQIVDSPAEVAELLPLTREGYFETPYASLCSGRLSLSQKPLSELDRQWRCHSREPLLRLLDDDQNRGRKRLEEIGLPQDAWFVTIHVREGSSYYANEPNLVHRHRNASLDRYLGAVRLITEHGGWVIRIGDPGMSPFFNLPQTLDCSREGIKSDWLDVYLLAKCRFLLGTMSGPALIPSAFGTPVLFTNATPFATTLYYPLVKDIVVPKLYWLEHEGRFATISESLSKPLYSHMHNSNLLQSSGVIPVENTEEEIVEAVREMLIRTENDYNLEHRSDLELQERVRMALPTHLSKDYNFALSSSFISRHIDLIN